MMVILFDDENCDVTDDSHDDDEMTTVKVQCTSSIAYISFLDKATDLSTI